MGKNEDPNLQQREQGLESGNNQGYQGWGCLSRLGNEFSFRCIFILLLSLSVLLPGIFWILPFHSMKSGFDAKQAIKLSAPVHAYFTLQKPVSELIQYIEKLEYDINEEIGVPNAKVAILSMHQLGITNTTGVVFGFLPDPVNAPINPVSLTVLRASLIDLFLHNSNLTLTTSIFGTSSKFEILKFPGGITIFPPQPASIYQITQFLFNFTLNNSMAEIQDKLLELKDQLKYGLHLSSYENVFVQLTNQIGSTISSPVIVQASVLSDFGIILPQRLKQLAETINDSPKNLGLNNTTFGKVKSVSLSSYLKGTLQSSPPTPSPAPSPGPSISPHPTLPPTHSPALAPKSHHLPPCCKCKSTSQPIHPLALSPESYHLPHCRECKGTSQCGHHPRHSPSPLSVPYPSFPPTPVSPAPSSAVAQPPLPCPYSSHAVPPGSSSRSHSNLIPSHPPVMSLQSELPPGLAPIPVVSYGSRSDQGNITVNGPASAPLAQSPSSLAVGVLIKEGLLLGFLGLLIFNLLL